MQLVEAMPGLRKLFSMLLCYPLPVQLWTVFVYMYVSVYVSRFMVVDADIPFSN